MANSFKPAHWQFMEKLCKALGLEGQPVQRITIVCDMGDVARVYVKQLIGEDKAEEVAALIADQTVMVEVVEDVQVDDKGEPAIKPLPNPKPYWLP